MPKSLPTRDSQVHIRMSTTATGRDHIRREILVGGISNTIFNGLAAWLLMKNSPDLRWGGEHEQALSHPVSHQAYRLAPFFVTFRWDELLEGKGNRAR